MINDLFSSFFENINKLFQNIFYLPVNSFLGALVSEDDIREIKVENIKNDVLEFIKENNGASIFEITGKFGISLDVALLVLKNLENEKKIKLNGKL